MVLYTSGSTGRPKGLVNSQRNLLRRVEQYTNAAHISADDRFMPMSSECTIAGIRERLTALLNGATLHLLDVQRAGARQILQQLRERQISVIYAVPALLRSLIQLDAEKAPRSLRLVRVGGDAVLWSDIDLLRDWLRPDGLIQLGYSSTEAPIMQWFVPRDFAATGLRVPIGYPLAGNGLSILDDEGRPLAPGEVGELVVRSKYVALGRWVDGICVKNDYPHDPHDPTQRIQHTGDLVKLRPDGFLDLIGRKDRQVKIRGQRVEPGEVEAVLRRRCEVQDTAILARVTETTTSLVAYVKPRAPAADTLKRDLDDYLQQSLPAHLRPQRIYFVDNIPRLPSAKLDMQALQALDVLTQQNERNDISRAAADDSGSLTASLMDDPARSVEDTVCLIWKRILKRQHVGPHDDFFELGGDSLATLNLMFELERAFGVELPVTMIYQFRTVASLAEALQQKMQPVFSPLVLIKEGSQRPPLFIVHGFGGNVMELFPVGRQIDYEGPVYAIQARGLDGREPPLATIEEMADYYLKSIRQAYPYGPYNLSGYSYGGLVAFEMACRLKACGEHVPLLALFDTVTSPRQWPRRVWIRELFRRGRHHFRQFSELSGPARIKYVSEKAHAFYRQVLWRLSLIEASRYSENVSGLPSSLQKVRHATIQAAGSYEPPFYDGSVVLLKSELGNTTMMCDPAEIWETLARTLETHVVPGDHTTMVEGDNAKMLARALSMLLKERCDPASGEALSFG
ncbi:MAG TPA: alpha/beta fold hydrolase [Terriglobales bacterium]|nr:alpha/beta fold hydrolase [Terriglobales bacterium]